MAKWKAKVLAKEPKAKIENRNGRWTVFVGAEIIATAGSAAFAWERAHWRLRDKRPAIPDLGTLAAPPRRPWAPPAVTRLVAGSAEPDDATTNPEEQT